MAPNNPRKKKNKKRSAPLAPPPHASMMKSRKRARQVTTLFHKYTREKDEALLREGGPNKEVVQELEGKIKAIGGREAYQQASQLSTSFHSTSKWVLGYLQRNGWLYGIPSAGTKVAKESEDHHSAKSKGKIPRRPTKLLEVGAINTELLDASERTINVDGNGDNPDPQDTKITTKKYRLKVRAIDLHSMHPGRIEEADFLKIPLPEQRYDVIVNSMVLNCVTTPEDRGEMLTRLYQFLRPGGILFLTIPKLCLSQSPFINRNQFFALLGATGVGFAIEETKESPKVAFFICKRPETDDQETVLSKFDIRWTKLKRQRKEKKFRNQFAVVLNKERCLEARIEAS